MFFLAPQKYLSQILCIAHFLLAGSAWGQFSSQWRQCMGETHQVFPQDLDSKLPGWCASKASYSQELDLLHQIFTLVAPSQLGGHVPPKLGKGEKIVVLWYKIEKEESSLVESRQSLAVPAFSCWTKASSSSPCCGHTLYPTMLSTKTSVWWEMSSAISINSTTSLSAGFELAKWRSTAATGWSRYFVSAALACSLGNGFPSKHGLLQCGQRLPSPCRIWMILQWGKFL